MRRALAAGGFVLSLGLASCGDGPADPDDGWVRVIGTLGNVVAPEQVDVGKPFTVLVNTTGSGSCTRVAGAEVQVKAQERLVRVVPYNEVPAPNSGTVCTLDSRSLPHAAAAVFRSPGEVTVRVVGNFYEGTPQGPKKWLDSLDYAVMIVGP